MLLLPLGVPQNITLGGALRPPPGGGRVKFLATLRNAALEPFLSGGAAALAAAGAGGAGAASGGLWRPDAVLFANDVFFCAGDALRLLAHGADLACGLDFYTGAWQAAAAAAPPGGGAGGGEGEDEDDVMLLREWVARDVSGARFRNLRPYVSHAPSAARLAAGLPFPAACCWDGLAAIASAPLVAGGLRFRAPRAGECRASECSLLCDDLHRTGRRLVVVDPGVRIAYEWEQALQLMDAAGAAAGGAPPARPWADVAAAPAAAALAAGGGPWRLRLDRVECCDLAPGKSYVNFRRDCHPGDVLAKNFTRGFLEGAAAAAAAAREG
ncbi:MAG: cryptococcal mannosyltransferase 1-domain-containing protein [Monoraphidium minutum]|nr:MAG: cryptococcal mannosyltransferase 1-domain-containing protein [Monoraphidium minutum]